MAAPQFDHLDDTEPETQEEVAMPAPSPRKRRSQVWQSFEATDEGLHRCRHCRSAFRPNTSTTSLMYHVRRHHPIEASRTADDHQRRFDPTKADKLVCQTFVKNSLSLRLADDSSFRELLTYLAPWYGPPSRRKLTRNLLPELREVTEARIRSRLRSLKAVSLTFDGWTSTANRAYLGLTCHGVGSGWLLESFMLGVIPVEEAETGAYIAQLVEERLLEWNLPRSKVVGVTTDGAGNMSNAVYEHLGLFWFHCLGHVFNLAVRKGLSDPRVNPLVQRAKDIARFFRSSAKAARVLRESQTQLGLLEYKLTVDNKTRWNSAHKMLKRLVFSRAAISYTLAGLADGSTRAQPPPDLTAEEWRTLMAMIGALAPLKWAVKQLSREKQPTVGMALPIYYNLAHRLTRQLETDDSGDLNPAAFALAQVIEADLVRRWQTLIEPMPAVLLMGVYLDPRFKTMTFIEDNVLRENLISRARRLLEEWLEDPQTLLSQEAPSSQTTPSVPAPRNREALERRRMLARIFGEATLAASPAVVQSALADSELERYHNKRLCPLFEEVTSNRNNRPQQPTDPLAWWRSHQHKYPRLAKLAKRYLCVGATSVSSERAFSKAGWIVDKRRCSLSDSNVAALVFLACNL